MNDKPAICPDYYTFCCYAAQLSIFITFTAVRCIFILLTLILPLGLWGQNITVSGKVVDRETDEPLSFASVSIKGKPVGTISNEQGEFDFHFLSEYKNEILVVSMLGYLNFEVPVWTIAGSFQTIQLDKSSFLLQEVVVVDSLTGGDILRVALSKIDENYPMTPFIEDGFYRDIKRVGGTYISLLEAAVKIYDKDYAEPRNKGKLRESVSLVEVRKSYGYESKFTDYFDNDNLLQDLLLHNNVRYRQIGMDDEMFASIVREKNSFYNGHQIYVVSRSVNDRMKVFIDKQDFAIVHLEYETDFDDHIDKKKKMESKFVGLKKVIDFKRYEGKMYLNYMTMTSKVNWYDAKTNELKFETELFQQLLINAVHANTEERISPTKKMRSYGLQYQDLPYNKKFWDNYNVIKDTPLDKEILTDLEKQAPLENQFESK